MIKSFVCLDNVTLHHQGLFLRYFGNELDHISAVNRKLRTRTVTRLLASEEVRRVCYILKISDISKGRVIRERVFAIVVIGLPARGLDHTGKNAVDLDAVFTEVDRERLHKA